MTTAKTLAILILCCVVLPAPAADKFEGDGNADFEKRLHRIYQKSGEPVDESLWKDLVSQSSAEEYKIHSGDTLWDVSRTLFGDGNYWSKVWAENGKIGNPHLIVPGRNIQFLPGTEMAPPEVTITRDRIRLTQMQSADDGAQLEARAPVFENPVADDYDQAAASLDAEPTVVPPEIPPSTVESKPVLKKFPRSFISPEAITAGRYDETGLEVGRRKAIEEVADVIPKSVLVESIPDFSGTVSEIEFSMEQAGSGETVFVKLNRAARVGEQLAVALPREKIKFKGRTLGTVIELQGIIELLEIVDEDNGIYRALVVESVNPIQVGAKIQENPFPRANFSREGIVKSVQAQIVGGEEDERRSILGSGSVVYLDRGSADGLEAGHILGVKSVRATKRNSSVAPGYKKAIGTLKIVKVTENTSTAFVVDSYEEISIGDVTSGELPKDAPAGKVKTRKESVDVDLETELEREFELEKIESI